MLSTVRPLSALILATALLTRAQSPEQKPDEKEYEELMQKTGKTVGGTKQAIAAKDYATVGQNAQTLQSIFQQTEKFWADHQTQDAVKWSQEAQADAKALAAAAAAEQAEGVATAFKTLTTNCGACHTAHREKLADGKYRIKY